ncbi:AIPR family protein [Nocardia gipuzkoensis]|uniref:AIPR family protein n=1 Tax=Nocardia gipuzkoensis TaxID=2749991 RepID=UPI001E31CA0A|nr:AIPR family protein [Nocardia gipuzkoensis]UGT69875.1 AIPR family protein [Nocardia gipuzkoensis]
MDPLIKGLFKEFRETQELLDMRESDAFELFVATLLLRDDLLDQIDMTDLLLDPGTIGIDLALLEVNGELVAGPTEVSAVCDSKRSLEVTLTLMQVKTSTSVNTSEILNFGDAIKKVLSNEVPAQHPKLSAISEALFAIYDGYASRLKDRPRVNLAYVTTANDDALSDSMVQDRVATVQKEVRSLSYVGELVFEVYGAASMYEASRRKLHANESDIVLEKAVNLPQMPGINQAILGVISVRELLKLIENENGSLNERVFYDNVRGFKGEENAVNQQIIETLGSPSRSLLPVLNNGVTVVARSYAPKPGDAVSLTGYQVVNGCQTSHCIFLAKEQLAAVADSVFVPMRLVVTDDEDVATRIIRATNSQTAVNDSDLIALTKFQKRLEDFYSQDPMNAGLTYERRAGQFYYRDVTRTRIVTISEQMRAVAATFLDLPHLAARYPAHLYAEVGDSIFDDSHRLAPYLASAFAAYRLETAFRTTLEPEFKPIRYHILTAYKYDLFGGNSASLNKRSIDDQSQQIVDTLRQPDYVAIFRETAHKIIRSAGGQLPTADRLKRQPFTQEMISHFMRDR